MSTTLTQLPERTWTGRDLRLKRIIRPILETLRSTQLRDGSLYDATRAVLPLLASALLWVRLVRWNPALNVDLLLNRSETIRHVLMALSLAGLWNLWLRLSPYDRRSPRRDVYAEVWRLATASLSCGVLVALWELPRRTALESLPIVLFSTACFLLVGWFTLGLFALGAAVSPRLQPKRAALVVGTGARAELLQASLGSQFSPVEVRGCVDEESRSGLAQSPYLGTIEQLPHILKTHPIEVVLIGLPMRSKYDEIQRVIDICETVGVETHYMREIFTTARSRMQAHKQVPHDFSVISAASPDPMQYLKRLLDILGASALLTLASPVMLATALAIRFTSHGPVLFVQQRYGRNRKRFPMFKFRSMVVDAEKRQASLEALNEAQGPVFKLKADPRVTTVGRFIRKTSIDELPQLFNVLRGEMSLVGPRPLPQRDVAQFDEPWLLRRFSVRPGLTCIWQVNGRSNTTFSDWMRQDLDYIDSWSLLLDVRILLQTVPAVLAAKGAV